MRPDVLGADTLLGQDNDAEGVAKTKHVCCQNIAMKVSAFLGASRPKYANDQSSEDGRRGR